MEHETGNIHDIFSALLVTTTNCLAKWFSILLGHLVSAFGISSNKINYFYEYFTRYPICARMIAPRLLFSTRIWNCKIFIEINNLLNFYNFISFKVIKVKKIFSLLHVQFSIWYDNMPAQSVKIWYKNIKLSTHSLTKYTHTHTHVKTHTH